MPQNRTLKKFCGITNYIQQKDKEFYQAIQDLCLLNIFRPGRRSPGVTFLYPSNKTYRMKIINLTYGDGDEPVQAINMIKSLLLRGNFQDYSDFNADGGPVNFLNQKVEVAEASDDGVKFAIGATAVMNKDFSPLIQPSRDNKVAVYNLQGKEEIPLDSPTIEFKPRNPTMGGRHRRGGADEVKAMQRYVAKYYKEKDNYSMSNNIYMKVAHLLMGAIIEKNSGAPKDLVRYLGNDEFTDSYFLGIYCKKNCPDVITRISGCLQSTKNSTKCEEMFNNISPDDYLNRKAKILAEINGNSNDSANANVVRNVNFNNITSPNEIRGIVQSFYKGDTKLLGRDLMIVYTAMAKSLWTNKTSRDVFDDYTHAMINIHDDFDTIQRCNNRDVARELTMWGGLLKSDVLNYSPQARFGAVAGGYESVEEPSPIELKKYSINKIQENYRKQGGSIRGGAEDKAAKNLSDLL